MTFVANKQLGPDGPPDRNRRTISIFQRSRGEGAYDRRIVEMQAVDPAIGWTEKETRILNDILRSLKREWPEWEALWDEGS